MDLKLSSTKNEDYLHFIVVGERTFKNIVDIASDILEECAEHKITKVLVDIREMTGELIMFEAFELSTKEFPKLRDHEILKSVAILDLQMNIDRSSFFETVAQNRGFNLKFFLNEDDAIAWLMT